MDIHDLQREIEALYQNREFGESPQTLTLVIMEEAGEVAEAVLVLHSPDFVASDTKQLKRLKGEYSVAHEVGDVITYCLALCNVLGIEPSFDWR